jgi:2-keto-4-pentenoate hydratase/2-oxohepta-3-ene-1,7-dioic acid hydratase in catechol pathway
MSEFRRLGPRGAEIPVLIEGATGFDLRGLTVDIDGAFLASDGIERARQAQRAGRLPAIETEGLRIGSPIARPGAVVCIGQNYAAHAAESGSEPPEEPIIFFKHPNTVIGAYDNVVIPPGAVTVDWEVELGIVIGSTARYLHSQADALACIAGLTISHDVSERTWQIQHSGGQWSKGKIAETFNPLGPALVPLDEIADISSLRLWSSVNGEIRQDSTTADMIFSTAYLVQHLSQYMVLDPGDLINSGTPQGVALSGRFPYLVAGDVVELGIESLGTQRQVMVSER